MSTLGVYFGPQLISIVEAKGTKAIKYIQLAQVAVSTGESLEEKVPASIKLVALLKDKLIQNNIEANEAMVSISGKDLIVRTFEMPIMPRHELDSAVNFEAKKYIPFKIEELISSCQYKLDKTTQKTRVLFVGIKKETLDNYRKIFNQLGIKIKSIEYSAFSILRLLKLAGIKEKGIMAVVNIDVAKDDEANFVVLEDGFPLFSHDISLTAGYEGIAKEGEAQTNAILEKLKREILISLDYYSRKFPNKNISKAFFITNPNYRADLDGFGKDLGLAIDFIDISKYIDKPVPFSLAFVKGYSSSLFKINIGVTIDLSSAKEIATKKAAQQASAASSLVMRFKSDAIVATICFLILAVIFVSGIYRQLPLQNELKNIINMRPETSTLSGELSNEELAGTNSNYKLKAAAMESIIKNRAYITPLLDAIPRVVPKGMWLADISFKKEEEKTELILKGAVYLGDSDKESKLVNTFFSHLKENPVFSKYFKEMPIVSTGRKQTGKTSITDFTISCQDYKKGKVIK